MTKQISCYLILLFYVSIIGQITSLSLTNHQLQCSKVNIHFQKGRVHPISPISQIQIQQLAKLCLNKDITIIDVRNPWEVKEDFIQNSFYMGYEAYSYYVNKLTKESKIVIFGKKSAVPKAISHLQMAYRDNIIGYADFSMKTWKQKHFPTTKVEILDHLDSTVVPIDVRTDYQRKKSGVLKEALLISLDKLPKEVQYLNKSKTYVPLCRSGYRARMASTFLVSKGIKVKQYPIPYVKVCKEYICIKYQK